MSEAVAMTREREWAWGKRMAVVFAIILVSVALDQVTKEIATERLKGQHPIIYLDDLFRLDYATNTGAFLSLGSQLPDWARFWVLTGLNSLILIGVSIFLLVKRSLPNMLAVSLALILSGGIGNLIDRVRHGGIVVDFMNIGWPWWPMEIRSGIFNVADLAIVFGLLLLVFSELFGREHSDALEEKKEA